MSEQSGPRVRSRRNLHSAGFEPYLIIFFLSRISIYFTWFISKTQLVILKAVARKAVHTSGSLVSYLPVQVFKIAYHRTFRAVHQRNAILQNVTYALLHPTDFCELSHSCAGLPYYELQIQVSSQKCPWQLVTGFRGLITQSEQIWIFWGLMCSSEQILHFLLYP